MGWGLIPVFVCNADLNHLHPEVTLYQDTEELNHSSSQTQETPFSQKGAKWTLQPSCEGGSFICPSVTRDLDEHKIPDILIQC